MILILFKINIALYWFTDGPNDPSPDDVIIPTQGNSLNEVIAHPLDQSIETKRSREELDSFNSADAPLLTNNKILNSEGGMQPTSKRSKFHGACLTLSDHDRLRNFIHEFSVRGLLPYIERMIRILSDQVSPGKYTLLKTKLMKGILPPLTLQTSSCLWLELLSKYSTPKNLLVSLARDPVKILKNPPLHRPSL